MFRRGQADMLRLIKRKTVGTVRPGGPTGASDRALPATVSAPDPARRAAARPQRQPPKVRTEAAAAAERVH